MIDRSTVDKWGIVVIAIALIAIGISIFFDPIFLSQRPAVQVNFGEYHQPIGFAISAVGGLLLYYITR
jgi:hypothetical protein